MITHNSNSVLVLNCGSSSLKFAIIDASSGAEILSGLAENIESHEPRLTWKLNGKHTHNLSSGSTHKDALDFLVNVITEQGLDQTLVAVGHRVVHGGEEFVSSALINQHVIDTIADMIKLAPLHNPANLTGINAAIAAFPNLPQVAVFDTAFHQTMPEHAYLYALPYSLYKNEGVRRYGFHGTSHHYVANQAAILLDTDIDKLNVITAHLGNGCSITAIKNGKSVDTSMGLTPLEGLVMGTRSGDIDPGIFNYLTQQLNMTAADISTLLNKQSGLLGLSEISNDCRTLQDAMVDGNEQAQLALHVFCYRIAKYIASYTVPLERLDALIFTGGIGENSTYVRETVLNLLAFFNFKVDKTLNESARFGQSGFITTDKSTHIALVIPTNEEWVIAQDAYNLAQEK